MAIDFDAIRDENIKDWGRRIADLGSLVLSALYSDQTHFIYELLQNAEDAGASIVHFRLYDDRLECEHNGRPFDEDDVRSICGLVDSTKADDRTKIGKFGIGFKSVYAYTSSPEVHSDDEHFAIENYVQPRSIGARRIDLGTLFVFPFNHSEKTRAESHRAIAQRLKTLQCRILLFLRNIGEISYSISGAESGTLSRSMTTGECWGIASIVTLREQHDQAKPHESWLVFTRDVHHLDGNLSVQIAFRCEVQDVSDVPEIRRLTSSPLSVFFPTEKETYLGFLVQGPFKTTPARDNVPQADASNIALANETGELVVDALRWLRDRDWLTVDVLGTMPLAHTESEYRFDYYVGRYRNIETERNQYRDTLFAPFYERVKQAMMDEAFIPAFGGGYVAAKDAKIAGSADLRELLDKSQLRQLLDFDDRSRWLSEAITAGRTPDLWRHLTTILNVDEFDAEMMVRRIDSDFMNSQTDDWVRRFYEYAPTGGTVQQILSDKPIIRLENGKHVRPFQAYLPKEDHESNYPTVKHEVCNSKEALDFLKKLGLQVPDDVDEVLTHVLRKYRSGQGIDEADHLKDIELIVRALVSDSYKRRQTLRNELESTPFLRATNSVGDTAYCKPGDIYFHSRELEIYFEGNPDGWFVSSIYEQFYEDLEQLGIRRSVRVWNQQPNDGEYVTLQSPWRGSEYYPHKRGRNGFDPEFNIEGLEIALGRPSMARSKFIWNRLLIPRKHSIYGDIESCPDQNFPSHRTQVEKNVLSNAGKLLRDMAWLPDGNGNFVKPSELSLEGLPEVFRPDSDLAKALGMIVSTFSIDDAPEDIKAIVEAANGRSPEELKEALALLEEKNRKERERVETLKPGEYPNELSDTSEQTGHPGVFRPYLPASDETDVTAEDKRIETELEMGDEPTADERYEVKLRLVWRPKNPETRIFLESKYRGCCQICGYTFQQRNGTNYFEAIHLIPRTEGKYLDHPRNALCLCAHHSVQFQHGERQFAASSLVDQIKSYEGIGNHTVNVELCGERQRITFHADHMIELKTALEVAEQL